VFETTARHFNETFDQQIRTWATHSHDGETISSSSIGSQSFNTISELEQTIVMADNSYSIPFKFFEQLNETKQSFDLFIQIVTSEKLKLHNENELFRLQKRLQVLIDSLK
jgi:hypothetical protein